MMTILFVACQQSVDIQTKDPIYSPQLTEEQTKEQARPQGVSYQREERMINGRNNIIHVLTVEVTKETVRVLPYLSFNKIYGFETLSDMADREQSKAAVTAGFFYMYGRPSGLVVNQGKTITAGSGQFNSLIIEKNRAYFQKVNTKITATLQNGELLSIDTMNGPINGAIQSAIYTQEYGQTDRLHFEHTAVHVIGNQIESIINAKDEVAIPDEGYLICFRKLPSYLLLAQNDLMSVSISPTFEKETNAYECSNMIVENSVNVAGNQDPWIGTTNQYDPRTCVGVDESGNIVFIVVEGRMDDYSSGVTGKELADICIDLSLENAAMLDGGASAEMILDGQIMNEMPFPNEERILAGGFLIFID